MDIQKKLQLQSAAWKTIADLKGSEARFAARFADPGYGGPSRMETSEHGAATAKFIAQAITAQREQFAALEAETPPEYLYRLKDPGAETRVSRLLDRTMTATPAGLARTYRELTPRVLAGDEESIVALHELIQRDGPEDGRMAYSKNLLRDPREAAALSGAIVAAQQALAEVPAVKARTDHLAELAAMRDDLRTFHAILADREPLKALDAFLRTNALPAILPQGE
ncbi:MAG: hypothetical protein ABR998_10370 [Gemmatimonadales bacterium]|jgi:hypothetical protein